MKPEQALKVIQQLQNVAIQKGMFADVAAVNHVTMAIASLQALLLEKSTA